MILVPAAAAASIVLCAFLVVSGRRMETSRAIRVHLPIETVWAGVRDFGALHAAHARGRPLVRIESTALLEGDGRTPRSVWIQRGRWHDEPYWAEIEIVAFEPPHRLAVRLRRDSLGTERGLRRHRCELRLSGDDPRETRVVLALSARFSGVRLPVLYRMAPEGLRLRLLDLAMRSVKHTLGALEVTTGEPGRGAPSARAASGDVAMPPPGAAPPMRDQV